MVTQKKWHAWRSSSIANNPRNTPIRGRQTPLGARPLLPTHSCTGPTESHGILFTLVVDDFGIKYTNEEDVKHLITSLEEKYTMMVDMGAKKYVGITL